ncbi:MAG: replicative DNA helicase [Candidatus Oxydemutatoraceae bacterium WSBS_2016_MAG_OTU14]
MSAVENIRKPPYSVEAEAAVIGGVLIDNDAWDKVKPLLTEKDFFKKEHRAMFNAINKLADTEQPFDEITLSEQLSNNGYSTPQTLSQLSLLVQATPSSANIEYYAKIVLEKSIRRSLIQEANKIIEKATKQDDTDAETLLDESEEAILGISAIKEKQTQDFVGLDSISSELYQEMSERDGSVEFTGLATGFADFDKETSGLQNNDLIIIAGRPSMGKTTLALNFVSHIANEYKKPIAIFSLEMAARDLTMRFYSALSGINLKAIRDGKPKETDWPRLTAAQSLMQDSKIFIDDSPSLTPLDMNMRVRRLKREHNDELGLVMVDYMQLMSLHGKSDNRVDEISKISRGLKALAREMQVPVIAMSQLNRSVEERTNKRPVMSDLRDSGAIEQDADLILFIYRDEQYDKETDKRGLAEIDVAKHRNGKTFKFDLRFKGEYSRFENYVSERTYTQMVQGGSMHTSTNASVNHRAYDGDDSIEDV